MNMAPTTGIANIQAARNIGRMNPDGTTTDALDIPGNLGNLTANGVLYADVHVGGTTNQLHSGRAPSSLPLPGLRGLPPHRPCRS